MRGKGSLILLAAAALLMSAPVYGADTKIYRSAKEPGVVNITNEGARKNDAYVKKLDQGDFWKNYTKLTPKKTETISPRPAAPPVSEMRSVSRPALSDTSPYSKYDVSHGANGHKSLGPIVINCSTGPLNITPIIVDEARKNNLDPVLLATVIKFESGFSLFAVSPAGACGLMQLMPDTARGLGVSDVFCPYQNIAGGARYIRYQLDAFNNNVAFALAAYNAGPGAVIAYGGIPPYQETVNYVNMILADYSKSGRIAFRAQGAALEQEREPEPRQVDIFSTLSNMKKARGASAEKDDERGVEDL